MTPGERKYDIDLVAAMRQMAVWIQSRSRKVADTLSAGADRIDALSSAAPIDPPIAVDPQGNAIQPASTPDQAR